MFKNKNLIFLPWLLFAIGITSLGVLAYQKKFDLVTENYYAAELSHSETMDKRARGMAFAPLINSELEDGNVVFTFPANFRNNPNFEGEIKFFRPSNVDLDKSFEIKPNEDLKQVFTKDQIEKGYWEIEFNWTLGGQTYLLNDTIMIK